MRQRNTHLKASARKNLLGHYGAAIAAMIVSLLVSIILTIPFTNMVSQGYYFGVMFRVVVGIIGIVIVMLFSLLFFMGTLWIHLRLARGQETRFTDIIYPFQNQPARYFGYGLLFLLLALPCILPGVICILFSVDYSSGFRSAEITNILLLSIGIAVLIVGVYIFIRILGSWFMASYRMLEYEDKCLMDSIRESRKLMKGNRKKWFALMLSFVGWLIFSLLSFGIALIWIVPYLTQSLTCFYLDLLPPDERDHSREDEPSRQNFRMD